MSAGSGASNLGYGDLSPYIYGKYVNSTSANNPAIFTDKTISGTPPGPLPGLAGTKSNVLAANGIYPGKGGSKNIKRKIKNITKYYKRMKTSSRKMKSLKSRLRTLSKKLSRRHKKHTHKRSHHRRHRQHGGYGQYQNNLPMTPVYKVAGVNLPANESALANPAPITKLSNCVNCVDNFSKFSMTGFPSKNN